MDFGAFRPSHGGPAERKRCGERRRKKATGVFRLRKTQTCLLHDDARPPAALPSSASADSICKLSGKPLRLERFSFWILGPSDRHTGPRRAQALWGKEEEERNRSFRLRKTQTCLLHDDARPPAALPSSPTDNSFLKLQHSRLWVLFFVHFPFVD